MKIVKPLMMIVLIIHSCFALSDEIQREVCVYNKQLEKYQIDRV